MRSRRSENPSRNLPSPTLSNWVQALSMTSSNQWSVQDRDKPGTRSSYSLPTDLENMGEHNQGLRSKILSELTVHFQWGLHHTNRGKREFIALVDSYLMDVFVTAQLLNNPGRVTEVLSLLVVNNQSARRSVFLWDGFIAMVPGWSKTLRTTLRKRLQVRFLPPSTSQRLVAFLVFIKPFYDELCRKCESQQGQDRIDRTARSSPSRAFLWTTGWIPIITTLRSTSGTATSSSCPSHHKSAGNLLCTYTVIILVW